MTTTVTAKIQVRNGTAAQWTSANPMLLSGEIGFETDTGKQKIGDGVTAWTALAYYHDPDLSGDYAAIDHNHAGVYEATGTASGLITTHEAAINPHPGTYAPAANGVTNGDSHDHSGGDGAQISYANLSNLPTLGTAAATAATDYAPAGHTHAQLHDAVTVADSTSIDLTLTGQQISAAAIFGTTSGTVCQGNDSRVIGALQPSNASLTSALIEKYNAIAASAIDVATGGLFSKTISGTTTFTISNPAASGSVSSFILELTNGGSATVNWWSGMTWASGTPPTLTASGVDLLGFYTRDGGTTWRGMLLAKDIKSP
jgi:hypothetical protein